MPRLLELKVMFAVLIFLMIYIALVYLGKSGSLESISPIRIKKTPGTVYMLQWTSKHTYPFAYMGNGYETFMKRQCSVMNCYVTANRELLGDITNFDVLLFHLKEVVDGSISLPMKRTYRQTYVFSSKESSGNYPVPQMIYNSYFNLTWTYLLDSDIYFGYFAIKNRNGDIIGPCVDMHWISNEEMLPINDTIKNKIANKKIAAAWFVSNCQAKSKRHELVKVINKEMSDYGMSIDVYGRCGNKQCRRSKMKDCLKLIEKNYYFYFAFENSFAEDYVTEKLLHALNHYAIPVVFGGANYTRFMPNGIYLDAAKLGPRELVKQMFDIINEPDRYNDFFKWHNHYSYHEIEESPDTDPYCKLCDHVNRMEFDNKSSVVNDLEHWWNPRVSMHVNYNNL